MKEMFCGANGYKMSPEMELYAMVCTSMLTPQYYVPNANDQLNRIKSRIKKVDPYFVAQLAVYSREQMYLRTIPLVLTVELAKLHNGDDLIRRLSRRVIKRADEIVAILDYYVKANKIGPRTVVSDNGHKQEKTLYKISNQLRKGIADAFDKFDEYQFAKYNRKGDITLLDALCIIHPKPRSAEKSELYCKIKEDRLSVPYTWEVELSRAGQEGRDKGEVWTELIESGKLGYMAMLRNLRNFLTTNVSDQTLQLVADRIGDREQVKRSKQLPFRFLSAYRMIMGEPKRGYGLWTTEKSKVIGELEHDFLPIIAEALERAALYSFENVPLFDEETDILMASDVSGSMQQAVSPKSIIQNFDIGAILMMGAQTRCKSVTVGMFGDTWKPLDDLPREKILYATNQIHRREGEVGYSTNGYKVINWALRKNIKYDRIMIFTDCQMYGITRYGMEDISGVWNKYKKEFPNAKLYLFNLNPYGQVPLEIKNDVFLISGWSDKIFNALAEIEKGDVVLNKIEEITL